MKALYVHVPFCDSICAYCDFCRVKSNQTIIDKWLDAFAIEVEDRLIKDKYDTVYIGGGTPTCLNEKQLEKMLSLIYPYTRNVIEYTIEINPESLNEKKCSILKKYGINRASIGVQTISDNLLKLIGRKHTKEDVIQCIKWLKKKDITNISCDCMYSLPTQTIQDVEDTLSFICSLDIPHISIYSLTIEENSQFNRDGYQALDDEIEADMYEFIIQYLENHWFMQYEISNFSKPGYQSLHNLHYWQYDDFVGLSLGASGKEENCRYDCTTNFVEYFRHNYFKEIIPLSKGEQMFEFIMMGLRLKDGFSMQEFQKKFAYDFSEVYKNELQLAQEKGYLVIHQDRVKCSDMGYRICNTVIEMFMKDG
ncbi:radical SAM family heme chaperone HemW [Anaerorhabdus furcosa]|uniref:Heme chaperone HemW n=1 Tax=Anaerorhabdus furcosa TaxID=118967 RepID=A0A1T4P4T2_9FIRM|nr:radical SAM family heme chaperone HemW [Anaerorhabdus furcosa]SJZ86610.1 oxygen-independent coproporphyrinogen-3 oxidase [Anaerorhabdus furcosa]